MTQLVASMSTLVGPVPEMDDTGTVAGQAVLPWLEDLDGFRGMMILTDEAQEKARVLTFWESRGRRRAQPHHAPRASGPDGRDRRHGDRVDRELRRRDPPARRRRLGRRVAQALSRCGFAATLPGAAA